MVGDLEAPWLKGTGAERRGLLGSDAVDVLGLEARVGSGVGASLLAAV